MCNIHKAIFEPLSLTQFLSSSQSPFGIFFVKPFFFFQKKNAIHEDLTKVNNQSNGAKVTVVVDYEPQKDSSQSHTLRQSDNSKIL